MLYVFIVLNHDRRRIVHFNVTEHPTAQWTAQQLVEAFPFDSAPCYLLRDRDAIYGEKVQRRTRSLSIEEIITAPRSPWQNPFVERVIGSVRRDCLDHIIVLNERHLRRILREMISRRAYGFRNFENYRLRVLTHCGWDGIINRVSMNTGIPR
ncbi:MAG: transposase [Haliea sp.]|nr:transposase [Haliea sp.]